MVAIGMLVSQAPELGARVFWSLHAAAIPCSIFGMLYAIAAMHFDGAVTRRARLVLFTLAALLIASTAVVLADDPGAVVYDTCKDPAALESWFFYLYCMVR